MTLDIQNLLFADCYFIDVNMNSKLNSIILEFEGYMKGLDKKQRFSLNLIGLYKIIADVKAEFHDDLERKYDEDGLDQRANEIYFVKCSSINKGSSIQVESDMLNLDVDCEKYILDICRP